MKYNRLIAAFFALMLCMAPVAHAQSSTCYVGCVSCLSDRDCASCFFCTSVTATARPAPLRPVSTPRPSLPPVRTLAPVKTAVPSITKAPVITMKPAATKVPSASNGDYTTISVSKQEEIVLELLNRDRANNGLPPLMLDPELSRIARIKSQDMKDNRYFAHLSPTYGTAGQMLTHFGYAYNGAGENIAHHATVEKSQAAFMSSPGHRANILGRQWVKVGIGVVFDDQGYVYVTQLFVR